MRFADMYLPISEPFLQYCRCMSDEKTTSVLVALYLANNVIF